MMFALTCSVVALHGLIQVANENVALKKTVAKAEETVKAMMTRDRRNREELVTLKVQYSKLKAKHEAATRRIAELVAISESKKGGVE